MSFLLYYFGVWAAGDAKYLLVLMLFIPHIGIFSFVGNLGIIVGVYLLFYFFYFYIGKCLIKTGYAKDLSTHIYTDLKDRFIVYTTNNKGERSWSYTIQSILKWLIVFLILYISFRLLRMYIINDLFTPGEEEGLFRYIFGYFSEENRHYIIFSLYLPIS